MEEKYLIATLFTNFDWLYIVQPENTNFHKPQSQCTLKVISQSCKVSKYFKPKKKKQAQNLLNQLDLVRFVPNVVISSGGIARLCRADQGTLKMEGTGEDRWHEDIKCSVWDLCADSSSTYFWHLLKGTSLSPVIKAFGTPSPTLTASTKFSGEKVMRRVKITLQSERQQCWVSRGCISGIYW